MSRRAGGDDHLLVVLHELRNPLIGIDAAARVLARDLAGHPASARASAIASEARHLLQLLESVGEAEAIAAGRLRSSPRAIDLGSVVRETTAGFQHERQIVVRCPDDAVPVSADPARIRQVLTNLLANAAQYSPPGTPIEVTLGANGRAATVAVRDRGPGIPAAERRKLFRKFARLSTADGTRGSGLGLYICKAIVEDHGGTIGYRERTFSFTLPLKRSPRPGDVEGGGGDLGARERPGTRPDRRASRPKARDGREDRAPRRGAPRWVRHPAEGSSKR